MSHLYVIPHILGGSLHRSGWCAILIKMRLYEALDVMWTGTAISQELHSIEGCINFSSDASAVPVVYDEKSAGKMLSVGLGRPVIVSPI